MPTSTVAAWETSQDLIEMSTLKEVLNFLEKRANSYANLSRFSNQTSNQFSKSANDNRIAQYTGTIPKQRHNIHHQEMSRSNGNQQMSRHNLNQRPNAPGGLSCHNCKLPHPMSNCFALKQMSVRDRENRVRELKLCSNCFSPNHAAKSLSCKAGPCKRCKKGLCRVPVVTSMAVATNIHPQRYQPQLEQLQITSAPIGTSSTYMPPNNNQATHSNNNSNNATSNQNFH